MDNIELENLCNESPAGAWRDSQVREYRIAQRRRDKVTCRIIARRLHAEGYAVTSATITETERRNDAIRAYIATGGTIQQCPPITRYPLANPRAAYVTPCAELGAAGDCGACEPCAWNRKSRRTVLSEVQS